MVFRRLAIGVVATAVLFVILAKVGVPLWLAAIVAGALQPYFKDLRCQ